MHHLFTLYNNLAVERENFDANSVLVDFTAIVSKNDIV